MLGPVSVNRLSLVHPTLAQLILQLESQMSEPIGITQSLRKSAEQSALWSQGRFGLDIVNQKRKAVGWAPIGINRNSETVTNAQPGYSWHEYGLAVDVVPFESLGHPDWNESHPVWMEIVEKGRTLGLVSGISWKDEPHLEWTCQYPPKPPDVVRQLMATGGLPAVWNSLQSGTREIGNETS